MSDNINMTADEFCDHWTEWCSMQASVSETVLLQKVLLNILKTFEERGSPTHNRVIFNGGFDLTTIYESPDIRKEPANG